MKSSQRLSNLGDDSAGLPGIFWLLLVSVSSLCTTRSTKPIYSVLGIGQCSPNWREVSLFLPMYCSIANIYFTPVTRNEFNNIITSKYNDLMKDIPKDDVAARREKMNHVYEWSKTSSAIPSNKSAKSIATKLENTKVQFSGLVSESQVTHTSIHSL